MDYIINFNNQEDNFKSLSLLYEISFVKVYLIHYVNQSIYSNSDFNLINDIIADKGPNPSHQEIKM